VPHPVDFFLSTGWESTTLNSSESMPYQPRNVCPIHGAFFFLRHGWESTTSNSSGKAARPRTKMGAPSLARSCPCAKGGKAQLSICRGKLPDHARKWVPHPWRVLVLAPWVGKHNSQLTNLKAESASTPPPVHPRAEAAPAGTSRCPPRHAAWPCRSAPGRPRPAWSRRGSMPL